MNDEPLKPDGDSSGSPFPKIIALFGAFIPSVVAIATFGIKPTPQWLLLFLLLVNAVCSYCSAKVLLSSIKDSLSRSTYSLLLVTFFFGLNVMIVLFVGCSGMGRIAP